MSASDASTSSAFRLAMVQMRVDPGRAESNKSRAVERIKEAARLGSSVVVLPEALTTGWTDPSCALHAEQIPTGPTSRLLAEAAHETGVYVCAGLIERFSDKIYNSAVLINP